MTQDVETPIAVHALTGTETGPFPTGWTGEDPLEVSAWLRVATGRAWVAIDPAYLTVTGADPINDGFGVELAGDLLITDVWDAGAAVALIRATPLDQPQSLNFSGGFTPEQVEAILNRLVRQIQDTDAKASRALLAPLGETINPLAPAAERALMILTFDAGGQPDTSKTYAEFVSDVAAELPVVAEIQAEGLAQIEAISLAGQAADAALLAARDDGLDDIAAAVSAGASALGLPTGGVIDVIPASRGYEEGWCFCDVNGWTAPAYYTHPTGTVGQVVRIIIPGADFSGLEDAERIYIPPPPLSSKNKVNLFVGQSNVVGQDSVPAPARTKTDFQVMLDTAKPTAWATAFGSTIAQAEGSEYIFSTTNHQHTTLPLAAGDTLEALIEDRFGQTFDEHGCRVFNVQVGLSSSDVTGFGYGTAHFTKVIDFCTQLVAVLEGLGESVELGVIIWAWGAHAYDNAFSQATVKSRIESWCGATGDVMTYLAPIFGQTGEVIPVGFLGSHHHFRSSDPITPQVAMAEQQLIAEQPTRYFHVQGEGHHFLNGLDRGWAGSTSHHHPNEEEFMGGVIADFMYSMLVADAPAWPNLCPTGANFARTAARKLTLTVPNWPPGATFDFAPTGLFPTGARPNHGWFLCDPASPTTEIALTRLPYPGASAGTLVFETATDLPTNLEVRYGCRTASDSIAGNTIIRLADPVTRTIKGASTELFRTFPALKLQVP